MRWRGFAVAAHGAMMSTGLGTMPLIGGHPAVEPHPGQVPGGDCGDVRMWSPSVRACTRAHPTITNHINQIQWDPNPIVRLSNLLYALRPRMPLLTRVVRPTHARPSSVRSIRLPTTALSQCKPETRQNQSSIQLIPAVTHLKCILIAWTDGQSMIAMHNK